LFADGVSAVQVAAELEVSTKSAYAWRRAWAAEGENALVSKGAPGPQRRLSEPQVARLIEALRAGPAAAGWAEDQRWTLARVCTLIGRMFHTTVALSTAWQLLRRAGFTPQQPIARGSVSSTSPASR
jgi:transposase